MGREPMLHFSRLKTAAILLTVFVLCGFAVPNLLPEETTRSWPAWAQRRIVLSPDIQGGSTIVLEVDRKDVIAKLLDEARQEARHTVRDAHVNLVRPPAVRGDAVEVRLQGEDLAVGFAQLREVFTRVGEFDVVDAGDGLVRLTPTEAAIAARARVSDAMPIIENRIKQLGIKPTVQRQGSDRILVQMPGLGDPRLLRED
jgi:preprotein translocase subunit SecD